MGSIDLLKLLEDKLDSFNGYILIGLGVDDKQNKKIFEICENFSRKYNNFVVLCGPNEIYDNFSKYSEIPLYRLENSIFSENEEINVKLKGFFDKNIDKSKSNKKIKVILSSYPEKLMLDLMYIYNNMSVIRGSISSSKFLKYLKQKVRTILNSNMNFSRIALMETSKGNQFFYAPVGIDEVNTFEKKKEVIINMDRISDLLKIPNSRISILSGGRKGDLGRDEFVDKTIHESIEIIKFFELNKLKFSEIHADFILIENSIENNSNFIIAPDGISGNLIYRTLVHLGGGKAFGALYTSIFFKFGKIIIDCSRVAEDSEIEGSLKLAVGFNILNKISKEI